MDIQAAEHALRVDHGVTGVEDIDLLDVRRWDAMTTAIFTVGGRQIEVTVERAEAPPELLTCHSEQPQAFATYRRISIEAVD